MKWRRSQGLVDVIHQLDALIIMLRVELLYQWEYNHFEHCGRTWPHPEGQECMWPQPLVLVEALTR